MTPFVALAVLLGFAIAAPARAQAPDVRVVRDQADAALAILGLRARSAAPGVEHWDRLTRSEGYRRLLRREAAMGRPLTDSAFRAFLLSDTMPARTPALGRTLEEWSRADGCSGCSGNRRRVRCRPRGRAGGLRKYSIRAL